MLRSPFPLPPRSGLPPPRPPHWSRLSPAPPAVSRFLPASLVSCSVYPAAPSKDKRKKGRPVSIGVVVVVTRRRCHWWTRLGNPDAPRPTPLSHSPQRPLKPDYVTPLPPLPAPTPEDPRLQVDPPPAGRLSFLHRPVLLVTAAVIATRSFALPVVAASFSPPPARRLLPFPGGSISPRISSCPVDRASAPMDSKKNGLKSEGSYAVSLLPSPLLPGPLLRLVFLPLPAWSSASIPRDAHRRSCQRDDLTITLIDWDRYRTAV